MLKYVEFFWVTGALYVNAIAMLALYFYLVVGFHHAT